MKKFLSIFLAILMLAGCSSHVSPETTAPAALMQGAATEPAAASTTGPAAASTTGPAAAPAAEPEGTAVPETQAAPVDPEPPAENAPTAAGTGVTEPSGSPTGPNGPSGSGAETTAAQTEPKPASSAPTEPAPTVPAASEPAPTEPAPTEPAPTQPPATEPPATEPAPTEPAAPDHVHDWVRNNYQINGETGEIIYAYYRCTICGEWKTVDFTTPPDTASDIPGHTHTWVKTQYDEVGYWDCGAKCQCGWTCYASESQHDGDYSLDWIDHINSSPKEEWFTVHISWCSIQRYILIAPAYVEWVCTECGETHIVQD